MVRFSVSLDEEQNNWVEQRAEELNGSKAQVIGMVIDAARQNDLQLGSPIDAGSNEAEESVETRLQSLESRVEDLESTLQQSPNNQLMATDSDRGESTVEDVEQTAATGEISTDEASGNGHDSSTADRDDPEYDAVHTFIQREANQQVSTDQISACWDFLKQRGTASSHAFKTQFAPESCTTEEEVDTWWEDGVEPVLRQLPGVDPPEDSGRFYRYKY